MIPQVLACRLQECFLPSVIIFCVVIGLVVLFHLYSYFKLVNYAKKKIGFKEISPTLDDQEEDYYDSTEEKTGRPVIFVIILLGLGGFLLFRWSKGKNR